MKAESLAQVIETKRSPPLWSVKAGNRYQASFLGEGARAKAERYAAKRYSGYEVRELPPMKRKLGKQKGSA